MPKVMSYAPSIWEVAAAAAVSALFGAVTWTYEGSNALIEALMIVSGLVGGQSGPVGNFFGGLFLLLAGWMIPRSLVVWSLRSALRDEA